MALYVENCSDETYDLMCGPCVRRGISVWVYMYCVDCSEYFCDTCSKHHEDIPALTRHVTHINSNTTDFYQTLSQDNNKKKEFTASELCDKHRNKYMDLYCQNHDDVGCSTCIADEHRFCKDIFYIPKFIENNPKIPDPDDTFRALKTTERKLGQKLDIFRDEQMQIKMRRNATLRKIEKHADSMKRRIDVLKKNTIKQSRQIYKSDIREKDNKISLLESMKSSVSSAKEKLPSSGNNAVQMFVRAKKGKITTTKARKCLKGCNTSPETNDLEFETDHKLSELLNEMTVLGETRETTKADGRKDEPVSGGNTVKDLVRLFSSMK